MGKDILLAAPTSGEGKVGQVGQVGQAGQVLRILHSTRASRSTSCTKEQGRRSSWVAPFLRAMLSGPRRGGASGGGQRGAGGLCLSSRAGEVSVPHLTAGERVEAARRWLTLRTRYFCPANLIQAGRLREAPRRSPLLDGVAKEPTATPAFQFRSSPLEFLCRGRGHLD